MTHTKEPWRIKKHSPCGLVDVFLDHGTDQIEHIANVVIEENARRIVACVNACAGEGTGFLEFIVNQEGTTVKERHVEALDLNARYQRELCDAERQIDEVIALLERCSESLGSFVSDLGWGKIDMDAMDDVDAFLARREAARAKLGESDA